MKLYGYWRSSAAYRVRIALNLKAIGYESIAVHLVKNGGEQNAVGYRQLNPNQLVPTLVDGEVTLNQSLAIIDYLDAKYPQPALYPKTIEDRAKVQALALDIACEIHPVNNLRVQNYLIQSCDISEQQKLQWSHHWMAKGLSAIEKKLSKTADRYCFGKEVTVADITLVPQVYNAKRFKLDMTPYPLISSITEQCNQLAAFKLALPENQSDAQ